MEEQKLWMVDICLVVRASSAAEAKERAEDYMSAASAELGHCTGDFQAEISGAPAEVDA